MHRLTPFLTWLAGNAANLLTTAALAGLGAGCWMAWPPLGLIVPSGLVLALLVYGQLRR